MVWEVRYRFLEPMLADSLRGVTMAMQVIYEKIRSIIGNGD